ncbi:MAG TPA: FAD-dependent oxidoreductase [Aliidongia sp.]|uniref:dihydrolipoyl dehydrogenase family protein n=1 Tax=Aliidongia sp. TaxID=1914230 RepID=UPI002DDD3901|nr:FAD-dependent oxidoreductase [Aliidongia sp.]HEV2678313.1 FAD-dependent oxidoreductase [Aliidongia sp.]
MSTPDRYDICVIGNGAAGLAVATGAALLGVHVALVATSHPEDDGALDLVTVALSAAVRVPGTEFAAAKRHVDTVLAAAAPANSPERLQALGIALIDGPARFTGPDRIAVGTRTITARRFVIANAGRIPVPAIPGLDRAPFLTRRTLAALDRQPEHLAIVGGGAEALELAQAYRRLGSMVTLIGDGPVLDGEDPELVDLLLLRLRADGVRLLDRIDAVTEDHRLAAGAEMIRPTHLVLATGRRPDLDNLGLDAAGVRTGPDGIAVDDRLRTRNRRIHALGDAIAPQDHAQGAGAQAGVVLRNILFRQGARWDDGAVPRVVQTDPGLAQVGLTEPQARGARVPVTILRWPFHDNDRARAEGKPHGLVKIVTGPRGRILGAGIVGPHAEELIQTWQLAIAQKLKIGTMTGLIASYPSLGDASKRAAATFFAPKLLGSSTRRLVRWLALFG